MFYLEVQLQQTVTWLLYNTVEPRGTNVSFIQGNDVWLLTENNSIVWKNFLSWALD